MCLCLDDILKASCHLCRITRYDGVQAVEAGGHVRDPVPAPERLPPPPGGADAGTIPSEVLPLYTSAGAGEALHRLEGITGINMHMLPGPGSGMCAPPSPPHSCEGSDLCSTDISCCDLGCDIWWFTYHG